MYTGMTKDQVQQIKALVDRGGWDAVRNHPSLSQVWRRSVAESRKWVERHVCG